MAQNQQAPQSRGQAGAQNRASAAPDARDQIISHMSGVIRNQQAMIQQLQALLNLNYVADDESSSS